MLQIFLQGFAVYFIVWWITLFAVLPIGLRTQAEDNDIVLGTVHSAPTRFRPVFVFSMTTLISADHLRVVVFFFELLRVGLRRPAADWPSFSNV